jgi:hypothetical protein
MKSFKQYLLEQENYEDFLRAHFGSEPAKPESHVLRSKMTGGVHKDIPLYIGIDSMTPHPFVGEGRRTMFQGSHPHYRQPKRIHSVIPMTFDSEAITNDKIHGKIHVVRYNATDAYDNIRNLWDANYKLNAPAEKLISKGKPARLLSAPDFMNHPILADNKIIHDEQDISIGEMLRQMHGGKQKYRNYPSDRYAFQVTHGRQDPNEEKKHIVSFFRKIKEKDDDNDDDGRNKTPDPSRGLQLA